MNLAMSCWPGQEATAGIRDLGAGQWALEVFLDPVELVISLPPFPDGDRTLARLCRALSRSAERLARELDPGPRHAIHIPAAGENR